jgi:uncharacterized protein (DUF885 family)
MKTRLNLLSVAVAAVLLTACEPAGPGQNSAAVVTPSATSTTLHNASAAANAYFDQYFDARTALSPQSLTRLGSKQDQDKWDALTDEQTEKALALVRQTLAGLQQFDLKSLDSQTQLSMQLFRQQLEQEIAADKWRYYDYPVNQMYGVHTTVPSLLLNQHQISSEADAKAYIARLNGVATLFSQLQQQLDKRAALGILPPKFVYPLVIDASRNLIKGAPFDSGADNLLLADFKTKISKLPLNEADRQLLVKEAEIALSSSVKPAYEGLITYLTRQQEQAGTDDGVWRFKDGAEFYQAALARNTTTQMTAEEIHQLGLAEVARIHGEMQAIMQKTGFKGSLAEFFLFLRDDPQFYYPNTAEGKAAYLAQATRVIDEMKGRLDQLFLLKPKADLIVKAVEPFREASAGKAFYEAPAIDGSRPGIYYANLYNMAAMPKYMLEALAYHEGVPGHHMQIAIAQQLADLPKFRKLGGYTAYIEGWGLYSELLPKEIGLYQDPYSDFGRLSMELWRACRLVVDTGIHAKQWTRQQAIDYLVENTPNARAEAVNAIDRYIVMPAQATAYKIGMIKIIELRQKAKTALGDHFDIRQFHDVVLKNGAVPLDTLEQLVDQYIAASQ